MSMLLIEHHAAVLKELASRIYVMRTGRIVAEAATEVIGPDELRRLYLGADSAPPQSEVNSES